MQESSGSRAALPPVDIFGVPLDLGGNRRGTDMGPSALRIAGLRERLMTLGFSVLDHGDTVVDSRERVEVGSGDAKYLASIARTCDALRGEVLASLQSGHFPLVIGGDHSIAMGTVAGVAGFHRERGESIGLIWVDAHADMNTPRSSPTGNVHGMPLGVLLGAEAGPLTDLGGFSPKVRPENVALIGIRDLDPRERQIVGDSGVQVFTMKEIDQYGMNAVAMRALDVVTRGTAGFHLSLDLDGLDEAIAPGVGTPVRGGLSFRESHLLMELLHDSERLLSMEVVELNPVLDHRNATAELAVALVQSALGRQIL